MKTIFLVLAGLFLPMFNAVAQQTQHATINTYSLSVMPAPAAYVPAGSQTADLVTFAIILNSGANIEKACIKLSSNQQSTGNLLNTCYLLSSGPVTHPLGLSLFRKDGNMIVVNVIVSNPQANTNYEVCTEDSNGQKSSYLSQIK